MGWHLSREDREQIVRIVDEMIVDPVGPEFMAPPTRRAVDALEAAQ